jgi:hypothetical protein
MENICSARSRQIATVKLAPNHQDVATFVNEISDFDVLYKDVRIDNILVERTPPLALSNEEVRGTREYGHHADAIDFAQAQLHQSDEVDQELKSRKSMEDGDGYAARSGASFYGLCWYLERSGR